MGELAFEAIRTKSFFCEIPAKGAFDFILGKVNFVVKVGAMKDIRAVISIG